MSLLRRFSRPEFLPLEHQYLRRSRADFAGLGKLARQRDRAAVIDTLKAYEEPQPLTIRRKPPPHTPPEPPPQIWGWEFVAQMRRCNFPHRIRGGLLDIWKCLEFDFAYDDFLQEDGVMYIGVDATIMVRPHHRASYNNWVFYTLHLIHHLALTWYHPPASYPEPALWRRAAEGIINTHLVNSQQLVPPGYPVENLKTGVVAAPETLVDTWLMSGSAPDDQEWLSPAGKGRWDVHPDFDPETARRFRSLFLLDCVKILNPQANQRRRHLNSVITRAYQWVRDNFPLLSSAAAEFEVDFEHAARYNIAIAAVSARDQVIYVNPDADLSELEWRWVMVHEILHVVLEHPQRLNDREPLIWNIACDYVINNWLEQMGVGMRPPNVLFKADYAGLDSETIYDQLIANGGNEQLRIVSFRGDGVGDMLDFDTTYGRATTYRLRGRFRPGVRQMAQNAARRLADDAENGHGRGLLPGGLLEELDLNSALIEEIKPPEWKTELAAWFNVQFIPKPPSRSYARPSRRQASVPAIPLPGKSIQEYHSPTFAVLLDTSGSMSHVLLQKGLAAVVAFAQQHGVAYLRLIMCDTNPVDEGFIPLPYLRKPYRIYGRGGTQLQPGVDLLESLKDFPADAPLLIITDGEIDVLTISREHAYLLPGTGELPFTPQGPIFRILGEKTMNNPFGGFRPRRAPVSSSFPKPRPSRRSRRRQDIPDWLREEAETPRSVVRSLINKLKDL